MSDLTGIINGHEVIVFATKKDILTNLLVLEGVSYINNLPNGRKDNKLSRAWGSKKKDFRLLKYCLSNYPDIMISTSAEICRIGLLLKIPSLMFSEDENENERMQLDFHQGYVLESIHHISNLIGVDNPKWNNALKQGLDYYRNILFFDDGSSYWRFPKKWPLEIHNQSQGIITFNLFGSNIKTFKDFSYKIADYTIKEMQAEDGHFYYQKFKYYSHKILYMRWSQAWMFLALTILIEEY